MAARSSIFTMLLRPSNVIGKVSIILPTVVNSNQGALRLARDVLKTVPSQIAVIIQDDPLPIIWRPRARLPHHRSGYLFEILHDNGNHDKCLGLLRRFSIISMQPFDENCASTFVIPPINIRRTSGINDVYSRVLWPCFCFALLAFEGTTLEPIYCCEWVRPVRLYFIRSLRYR